MGDNFHVRVDFGNCLARRVELRAADVARPVDNLPLEIGEVHHVEIHDTELADARRRQIQSQWRAQPPGTDGQHLCLLQFQLPVHADFGHDEVPAVAQDFVIG